MEKSKGSVITASTCYGDRSCTRNCGSSWLNEWNPKHSGEHLPDTGPAVHHTALQLPLPDRMYVLGAKAANRGILLVNFLKFYT